MQRRILYITDHKINPEPWVLFPRLPKGATILIRDYDHSAREAYATAIMDHARAQGLAVLMAGDLKLARRLGADGLHLPEWQLARFPERLFLKPGFLITAAAHSEKAIIAANRRGAGAILLSPVFQTGSHPKAKPLGPVRFAGLARKAKAPVWALGGVKPANFRRLNGSLHGGFAMISSWLA